MALNIIKRIYIMIGLKLTLVNILSNVAIIIINTILIVSFYNFVILSNISDFMKFCIPPSSIFFLLFTLFIYTSNNLIPFSNYDVNSIESINEAFVEETLDIIFHILISFFITAINVLLMYGFTFL